MVSDVSAESAEENEAATMPRVKRGERKEEKGERKEEKGESCEGSWAIWSVDDSEAAEHTLEIRVTEEGKKFTVTAVGLQ